MWLIVAIVVVEKLYLDHDYQNSNANQQNPKLGLVADPVIETIERLEFEDGLRTEVLLGDCWDP